MSEATDWIGTKENHGQGLTSPCPFCFTAKLLDGIANSGVFFHTDYSVKNTKNHLAKGFEAQLNNQARDNRVRELRLVKRL